MLEAMACGSAVISSRHTNARQLVEDGVNGFTVPIGDVESYVHHAGRLISDEPFRLRLVKEGLRTAMEFTWENAVDKMEGVLGELLLKDASSIGFARGASVVGS